tara:strand:+ start:99 stop:281 length:183 start_codon:yes stop_codon:yes gene_type:complete
MTVVLGISEASSDSSACIIRDGVILGAIDEESVRRIKHCPNNFLNLLQFYLFLLVEKKEN